MTSVRAATRRILALFQSHRLDRELAMEIESHLELHISDNMRAGMSRDEARRHARLALGGVVQTQERYRDRRGIPIVETIARDVKYGLGRLLRAPIFSLAAIGTIGIGVGVNVVAFAFMYSAFVRPLPYDRPEQLVLIESLTPEGRNPVSPADFQALAKSNQSFSAVAAATTRAFDLTAAGTEPRQVRAEMTTSNVFPLYRLTPQLGRFLSTADERPEAAPVVVLGHALWQQTFGADPAIVGRTIALDDERYTVVGVARADAAPLTALFRFGPELWLPLKFTQTALNERVNLTLFVVGRLKDSATFSQAEAEVRTVGTQQALAFPNANTKVDLQATRLRNFFWQTEDVQGFTLTQLSAGFVLVIVCLNIVNLLIARGVVRSQEIAIRSSLGASRGRIAGQLIAETVVIFLVGGAIAVFVAAGTIRLLLASWAFPLPAFIKTQIDWPTLGFTLVLTVAAGIISSLAPALLTSHARLGECLKEAGRSVTRSPTRRRLATGLVSAEIALALVLLTGAALALRSLSLLYVSDPGFDPKHLLTAELSLPESRYRRSDQMTRFVHDVDAKLEHSSAIVSSTWTSLPPLFPFESAGRDISIEGLDYNRLAPPHAELRVISPGFFSAIGTPIVEGREFTAFDNGDAPPRAIVNRLLATRFWPHQSPIGHRLRIGGPTSTQPWMTIVGVVGDIHQLSRGTPPAPEMYIPYLRSPRRSVFLVIRTAGSPEASIAAIKQEVWAVDPNLPVSQIRTMDQATKEDVFPQRMMSSVLGVLSIFALLLAALGTYAIVSHGVSERQRELAIRAAFGASPRNLIGMVFRQMVRAIVAGIVLGVVVSVGLGRAMRGFLFGVTEFSPMTILFTTATLVACAALAIYVPARRVASIDPMVALRQE